MISRFIKLLGLSSWDIKQQKRDSTSSSDIFPILIKLTIGIISDNLSENLVRCAYERFKTTGKRKQIDVPMKFGNSFVILKLYLCSENYQVLSFWSFENAELIVVPIMDPINEQITNIKYFYCKDCKIWLKMSNTIGNIKAPINPRYLNFIEVESSLVKRIYNIFLWKTPSNDVEHSCCILFHLTWIQIIFFNLPLIESHA